MIFSNEVCSTFTAMSSRTLLSDQRRSVSESVFDIDYTQLVMPRTHVISDSDNGSDEE
jgi:hypothetical protein